MAVTLCSILTAGLLCVVYAQSDIHKGCGTSVVPLIPPGSPISYGEYPWLAALYREYDEPGKWEQSCGGALLSPRIVITAAHCLIYSSVVDPKTIKIGLGKQDREFYWNGNVSNIFNVTSIVIPKHYVGSVINYALDVGLLRLATTVQSSNYVMPVCLDFDTINSLQSGAKVYATGEGMSENGTSADLSYLDYHSCLLEVQKPFHIYITLDKMCTQSSKGSLINKLDSGGPLTYLKDGRHFVLGVLSLRLVDQKSFVYFTNLSSPEIRGWVKENMVVFDKEFCPPLESNSLFSRCLCGNTEMDCSLPMPPTTIATYQCRLNYTEYPDLVLDDIYKRTLVCNNNGTWSLQVPECKPGEGSIFLKGETNIASESIEEKGKCIRRFLVSGNVLTHSYSVNCSSGNIITDNGHLFFVTPPDTPLNTFNGRNSQLVVITRGSCTKDTHFHNITGSTGISQDGCVAELNALINSVYSVKSDE